MEAKELLPALLGYVLRQETVPQALVPQQWEPLVVVAGRHKVLGTLACVVPLLPQRPDEALCRAFEATLMEQMLISSNQLHAARKLREEFELRGLYHMMLKGINTKLRYPQDYMRSMNDMDILCKPGQNAGVKRAMDALGYVDHQPGRKHDHYRYPPYLLVEMHRQPVASRSGFSAYYQDVWQRCRPLEGCEYSYEMPVEDEYIFTLIHLTEHFRDGGVGIRFVMDVYVYETMVAMDRAYLDAQLQQLGLYTFYRNLVKLAMHWFQGGGADEITARMARYVYSGGVYGSAKNASANAVSGGGRLRFLLSACFPDYREMCSMYPWLKKWPIALPLSWGVRGADSLLHRRKNIKAQLQTCAVADEDHGKMLKDFYRDCGL